eukprot:31185-Pelagococcus_subviridis.AAC.3
MQRLIVHLHRALGVRVFRSKRRRERLRLWPFDENFRDEFPHKPLHRLRVLHVHVHPDRGVGRRRGRGVAVLREEIDADRRAVAGEFVVQPSRILVRHCRESDAVERFPKRVKRHDASLRRVQQTRVVPRLAPPRGGLPGDLLLHELLELVRGQPLRERPRFRDRRGFVVVSAENFKPSRRRRRVRERPLLRRSRGDLQRRDERPGLHARGVRISRVRAVHGRDVPGVMRRGRGKRQRRVLRRALRGFDRGASRDAPSFLELRERARQGLEERGDLAVDFLPRAVRSRGVVRG